jgi:tryptophan-rich sensory protein
VTAAESWWFPVLLALGWAIVLGVIGGWLTRLDGWYERLRFPAWKPPDWAFGPVWTTIFLCAGTAFVLAWRAGAGTTRGALVATYVVNGALNMLWSWLFFRRHRPDHAYVESYILWVSILAMLIVAGSMSPWGYLLLAPYLVWVTVATALTGAVVRLNGPFPR